MVTKKTKVYSSNIRNYGNDPEVKSGGGNLFSIQKLCVNDFTQSPK